MMLVLHNVGMGPSNVRKKITKYDKNTVKCDVKITQCDDVTVKCEKK